MGNSVRRQEQAARTAPGRKFWSQLAPGERIVAIRSGVAAADAKSFLADLGLPPGFAMDALRLSRATMDRKIKLGQPLGPEASERIIGLAKLVGQVDRMVIESGDTADFDAEAWVSQWLREPVPALGGERPIDLLDTMEGQALVSQTLARMQSGAYA